MTGGTSDNVPKLPASPLKENESRFPHPKGIIPVSAGLFVFSVLMLRANSGGSLDITHSALMHSTAFLGVTVVYCIFAASIIVAIVSTLLYQADLDALSDRLHNLPGRPHVKLAKKITVGTTWVSFAVIVVSLVFQKPYVAGDGCSYRELSNEFYIHVGFVGALFVSYLIIDLLTLAGTSAALAKAEQDPELNADGIRLDNEYAWEQIFFIDAPVLIGAVSSLLLVWATQTLNPGLMKFDPKLLTLDGKFICNTHNMSIESFETMVSNIFISGIATGFVAAHILMSQLVFVALGWIFLQKRRRLAR